MDKSEKFDHAVIDAKKAFYAYIATINSPNAHMVESMSFQNSMAVETYNEYSNDLERWNVALDTAKMIMDAPSDYNIDL